MNNTDKVKFLELFTGMCEMFDKKYSEVLVSMYFKSLKKFDIETVEMAISKAVDGCKFFPKPVELIELMTGGQKEIEYSAENQLTIVMETLRRIGDYSGHTFKDPVTDHLMKRRWPYHGWYSTVLETEFNKFWPDKFKKAYVAADSNREQLQIEINPQLKQLTDKATKGIE